MVQTVQVKGVLQRPEDIKIRGHDMWPVNRMILYNTASTTLASDPMVMDDMFLFNHSPS
jgi:hypothetical protein